MTSIGGQESKQNYKIRREETSSLVDRQIIIFSLTSGDKVMNNIELFPVVKDPTVQVEAPVNFYWC